MKLPLRLAFCLVLALFVLPVLLCGTAGYDSSEPAAKQITIAARARPAAARTVLPERVPVRNLGLCAAPELDLLLSYVQLLKPPHPTLHDGASRHCHDHARAPPARV